MAPKGKGLADETEMTPMAGVKTETNPASGNAKGDLQVIVLGPSGGPCEDNITGMLVRSTSTDWGRDSMIAVDAGTLLCGLRYILETNNDNGPFAGMDMPFGTAKANAAHILREIVGPVLVTHAHLDHISGFVVNTPILEGTSNPKRLSALPSVIAAFKEHIFNGVLWPNLSDENGGAGLISFQRLVEGGNPLMGRDNEKGYVRACEGLMTRCFGVSHGRCNQENQARHTRSASDINLRRSSVPSYLDPGEFQPWDPTLPRMRPLSPTLAQAQPSLSPRDDALGTVESSAFFIRDHLSGTEIIIFGDIEPDSVSLRPRNRRVWQQAAPKIVSKDLRAIFIECSYDDSVSDDALYGHLCPRHLITELKVLGNLVFRLKNGADLKRKRDPSPAEEIPEEPSSSRAKRARRAKTQSVAKGTPSGRGKASTVMFAQPSSSLGGEGLYETDSSAEWPEDEKPLEGLTVYLIHIKDDMSEGESVAERILNEVRDWANAENLGCEFHVPSRGKGIYI